MFTTADSEEVTYDESCSDCKVELSRKRWIRLLLRWLHKCVNHEMQAKTLTTRWLVEIINRYKDDICDNELDKAILCTDDLEPFLTYKYPILRLRNLFEEKDQPRKLFIMASVLLYHCCISSQAGAVETDIIQNLPRHTREMILKFCESLSEMEITVNNVENAIRMACNTVHEPRKKKKLVTPYPSVPAVESVNALNSDSSKCPSSRSTKHSSLTFKSSVTVLSSSASNIRTTMLQESDPDNDYNKIEDYGATSGDSNEAAFYKGDKEKGKTQEELMENQQIVQRTEISSYEDVNECHTSQMGETCSCTDCLNQAECENPCETKKKCKREKKQCSKSWRMLVSALMGFLGLCLIIIVLIKILKAQANEPYHKMLREASSLNAVKITPSHSLIKNTTHYLGWAWVCENKLCKKVYQPLINFHTFAAYSQCILICSGPQIWPQPLGSTSFSKTIVALATEKLEYKFKLVESDNLHQYVAEAFKLFLGDLARLEKLRNFKSREIDVKRINIIIEIETDPDPRFRLNTDEAYSLKVTTDTTRIKIHIKSNSFCGVRHGFETLSQLILLDQSSGSLITLSEISVKDAPSYRYRGLMLDTARNYIPVSDILRTIDGMASVKLNTFHWRITDSASFPLFLPNLPDLFEYGAYDRSMVYTKDDVTTVVNRAGVRGIRVLMEVAAPGPVGRAWSWSEHATCPKKNDNFTCENVMCTKLKMTERLFGILQKIYSQIIEMTGVDDIFHLSDSVFSLTHCYLLLDEREGFLEKALEQLRLANKGFLPTLPVIWYTSHLSKDHEAKSWERYGVQIYEWPALTDRLLSRFRVIHSSKWDLSCEMKKQRCLRYRSWQEMYAWKSFRTIEAYSTEGGEAILWTDLVDSGNLDTHLWPRTAAVAERLWSDMVANRTADGKVYQRLDNQRRRLLLKGLQVQPIWPAWCSFNPHACFAKISQGQ